MVEIFPLKYADVAYNKISRMIATLDDPFTRIINPKVVMSCVEGSPAYRAGIQAGKMLDGIDAESVAQKLQGHAGTTVKVKVRNVILPREVIQISPVSRTITFHKSDDGRETKTGYVRLSSFSQTAAVDMENAIREMEGEGVRSYILDLRNNPGGLVEAGLDVTQIWLDGDETLVNTIDRDGNMFPINMIDGHALTRPTCRTCKRRKC